MTNLWIAWLLATAFAEELAFDFAWEMRTGK